MENKIALSIELVNGVLNYLSNQPYAQVYPLIAAISKEAEGQLPSVEKPVE